MHRVARRFLSVLGASMLLAGCSAGQPGAPARHAAATRSVITRSVTFTRATPPSSATGVAPTIAGGPHTTVRSATPHQLATPAPSSSAPAVASTGSPWPVFTGHITGAVNEVARVLPETIGVSLHAGEAPLIGMSNRSPLGAPRVFLVVEDAGEWLRVLLPMRPNSSMGWVRRADVEVTDVHYRIEVDRLANRMQVLLDNNVITEQPTSVGKSATPTPVGQFFTVELLQPPNGHGAYGPYAFTLSAYSNVFQTFGSGDGAVGLHGTNEPGSIGRAASHGCVRLANDVVTWMAGFLPLGTPVFIR